MSVGINAVVLLGNLTADPDLRHTQGGTAVCGLRIAVNGREKVGDSWRDRADFFDIRVWGNQGERCAQYLSKGSQCCVSGTLRLEQWEKGGEKHSRVLVVARDVQFIGKRSGGERESAAFVPDADFATPSDFGGDSGGGGDFAPPTVDDDIPF